MGNEAEGSVKGDGDGSGADGDMGRRDADEIDEKRHRQDRTPPPIKPRIRPTKSPEAMAKAAASSPMVIAAGSEASRHLAGSTA